MLSTLITCVLSYISTNIDNLFILLLLYAIAENKNEYIHISFGQFLGTALLVVISVIGALGATNTPKFKNNVIKYQHVLVPTFLIILGILIIFL